MSELACLNACGCCQIIEKLRQRDWHPISTAPKDGTRFLAYFPADPSCQQPPAIVDAFIENGNLRIPYDGSYGHPYDPTHWMPLPDPPEATP